MNRRPKRNIRSNVAKRSDQDRAMDSWRQGSRFEGGSVAFLDYVALGLKGIGVKFGEVLWGVLYISSKPKLLNRHLT